MSENSTDVTMKILAGCVKRHPSEAQTPEIVIPANAGIQAGWGGGTPL